MIRNTTLAVEEIRKTYENGSALYYRAQVGMLLAEIDALRSELRSGLSAEIDALRSELRSEATKQTQLDKLAHDIVSATMRRALDGAGYGEGPIADKLRLYERLEALR